MILLYIRSIFNRIGNFFLCFLRDDCVYSAKKLLVYIFSGVSIYLIIFTDKDYYQILVFIGLLLGIRSFEKFKLRKPNTNNSPDNEKPTGKKQVL